MIKWVEQMGWLIPKRVTGFEPATIAWKATVLPLNYTRWPVNQAWLNRSLA